MRIVVALGGNALLRRGEPMTADNQRENVRIAAEQIAKVAPGNELVIAHGNGPQVGLLALQGAAYDKVSPYPLDVLGAETEGMIGYMIEQEMGNLLPFEVPFATILTQVEVDGKDPAFQNPTKPIGPVYSRGLRRLGQADPEGHRPGPPGRTGAPRLRRRLHGTEGPGRHRVRPRHRQGRGDRFARGHRRNHRGQGGNTGQHAQGGHRVPLIHHPQGRFAALLHSPLPASGERWIAPRLCARTFKQVPQHSPTPHLCQQPAHGRQSPHGRPPALVESPRNAVFSRKIRDSIVMIHVSIVTLIISTATGSCPGP